LPDLYKVKGAYTYAAGWNWRAVLATLLGCALAWGGLVIPALKPLYDYAWFVGFIVSGTTYLALMKTTHEGTQRSTKAHEAGTQLETQMRTTRKAVRQATQMPRVWFNMASSFVWLRSYFV
jgi:hypothetical protein